ncbi:type II toxin-antitoxin system VapC family toxin [Metallosphaera tengchongensis]|uniref:Type II toxin-antitoxin system VapC family toxin n=1 Tax=Metallosphaera tengchongensis TaxID=1532350 RepID=A0A6N0NVD0_9CREN|nr:type II toxin-antitoxin system VapC family toxin [Metallosphaera tengchongensis]QKR00766.1 type II toxin-antitoxin system VapC family toxin [Metallosphaera tengchongensis]
MTVLDSNVIIRVMKGDKSTLEAVKSLSDVVGTTVFNVYEILRSKYSSKVSQYFEEIVIYPFTIKEAVIASHIYRELSSRGKVKGEVDILISSIVKANNETLITYDRDFYDISKVSKINVEILD